MSKIREEGDPNPEYDFMDNVCREDLLDRIEVLHTQIEKSRKALSNLESEKIKSENDLQNASMNYKRARTELRKKEDDTLGHEYDKLLKENELSSQKYMYF